MKRPNQQGFLILVIFLMCAANLAIAVNAINQREEIVCILQILPEERPTNPDRVEACR